MERLFTVLTATAIALILVAGVGVYVSSKVIVAQEKEKAIEAQIKAVVQTLGTQIDLLNNTLDKMAQDPDVIAAFASSDSFALKTVAARLETHFPLAKKIRLLPVGTIEPDEANIPKMGFGDVDMVKQTFQGNPLPAIQGDVGADQHLAMTRRVVQNNQVVGVILASLSYDFIQQALKATAPEDIRIEIKQAKLVLAESGTTEESEEDFTTIKIPGTDWNIEYSESDSGGLGQGSLYFALIFIPILLVLGIFYTCYQQLMVLLAQDQDWILTAFKDVLTDRPKGSYPVNLNGMSAVIASMVRFNREIEAATSDVKGTDDEFELEGFFEGVDAVIEATEKNAQPKALTNEAGEASPTAATDGLEGEQKALENLSDQSKRIDPQDAVFRAYDIRGIVGDTLTTALVSDIGRAFGSEAKQKGCNTVVIGRDGRLSSPDLFEALAKGITSTGCNVLDVGTVPTPVLYFVVQHTDGRTGIMITGSHNPANYNGLKMMMKGETLAGDRIKQLKERIDKQDYVIGEGSIQQNSMFESEYIGTLCDDIQVAKRLKVVVDCGNGVAGGLAPVVLKNLGCDVIELFCEIDGNFPNHHPDPSKPENLTALIAAVKDNDADVGLAFDGDGDRLGVVDSNGKIIWPDRQMMLFAKDVLAGKPGSEIIFDVKCSRHLPTQIVKYGGRPLMWKTGHSFMKAKLKETAAKLAGEMSGHIFFNDRWFGFDDALYAAARLIQILSEDDRPSAEVFADFPDSVSTPELNVELAEGENVEFIKKLFATAKFTGGKVIDIDGMRIDFSNGWGLVRASNTTPSLVIRFEADSKEALENIQSQFRDLMHNVKPDIKLPF